MLPQGDSQVFMKYSQMKVQMKREALEKLNRQANEMTGTLCQNLTVNEGIGTVVAQDCGVNPSVETVWNWHTCCSMVFPSQTYSSPSG
jgi:hypothetical protein